MVKLTKDDYDKWKKRYHAIPDLDAELQRIDDGFKPGDKWFVATSSKLAYQHRRLMAQKRVDLGPKKVSLDALAEQVVKAFTQRKSFLAVKDYTVLRQLYTAGKITKEQAEFCGYRP